MTIRKTKEDRRAEIVEATLRLAATMGPDRITASMIAAELGLSQPAIFRHFPTKDDIWNAVMDWVAQSLTHVWEASAANSPPQARLTALVEAHLRFVERNPAIPLVLLSPELQARHAPIRDAINRMMALFHGILMRAVAAQTAKAETARAAWMLLAIIQGVALRWIASGQSFDITEEGLSLTSLAIKGVS